MDYMTAQEAADKWGVSQRRVHKLCEDGRIEGVRWFGRNWMIPGDAEKPPDARVKSGKYKKQKALEVRQEDGNKDHK